MDLNRRLPRVDNSTFAMVPRADVPRATFRTQHTYKTTFNTGFLIPFYVDEVLPGDIHHGRVTIFARLATLLYPIMDNVELETFFFFTPNRIIWDNWVKMQGEQVSPGDSISYTTPQIVSPAGGFAVGGIYDYLGLPTVGQVAGGATISINALPLRAYALIFREWFRDENLDTSTLVATGDGPDVYTTYALVLRRKKHDYFTSALPWPQKATNPVQLPLSGTARITGIAFADAGTAGSGSIPAAETGGIAVDYPARYTGNSANVVFKATAAVLGADPMIYADLSTATGASINALRLAIQTQRLLEKDARGGTRYTETLRFRWGIQPQDARLQRPEYIGGGRSTLDTAAIPQTAPTSGSAYLASLGATSTITDQHSFSYNAQEHGYILGLVCVRGEVTYQQGIHRMWTRLTRYDFYNPEFAHLGEQAIRNDEIYARGDANDTLTFGYQERWSEYRYRPSQITGFFRSTTAGAIDSWHLSQKFTALPALNSTFIQDGTPTSRVLAAGAAADGMQILFDSVFDVKRTRPMPMRSVPGMMDHF